MAVFIYHEKESIDEIHRAVKNVINEGISPTSFIDGELRALHKFDESVIIGRKGVCEITSSHALETYSGAKFVMWATLIGVNTNTVDFVMIYF